MNLQHLLLQIAVGFTGMWLTTSILAVDTSGWDWEAIEETNTTVTAPRRELPQMRTTPALPPTAQPDFSAKLKSAYTLFPEMPVLEVIPATKDTAMHPCGNCHRWSQSNLNRRILNAPHDNFTLEHGLRERGQIWCFTCHDLTGNDGDGSLRTLDGTPLNYDESYLLCTQCHSKEGRDWAFGVHGKRVENWRGQRRIYNCTACHYQHSPTIAPRKAKPGPKRQKLIN